MSRAERRFASQGHVYFSDSVCNAQKDASGYCTGVLSRGVDSLALLLQGMHAPSRKHQDFKCMHESKQALSQDAEQQQQQPGSKRARAAHAGQRGEQLDGLASTEARAALYRAQQVCGELAWMHMHGFFLKGSIHVERFMQVMCSGSA